MLVHLPVLPRLPFCELTLESKTTQMKHPMVKCSVGQLLPQVGLQGLEAGLDKFEPRRGGRLTTTVYWCAPAANPVKPCVRSRRRTRRQLPSCCRRCLAVESPDPCISDLRPCSSKASWGALPRSLYRQQGSGQHCWNVTCELNACACRRCWLCCG